MTFRHPSIISARFSYTSSEDTLPQLVDSLNYILPDHVPSLMSALFGKNMKHDSRVASGYSPHLVKLQIKVKQMLDICQAKPHWFIDSHYKQTFQDELQKEYRISSSATQLSTRNCNPSDSSQDFESVEEAEMPVIERNEIVEFSNGRSSSSLQTDFDETTTGDSGIEASIPLCSTTCELNSEIDNQDVQSEETLENQDIIKTKESPGRYREITKKNLFSQKIIYFPRKGCTFLFAINLLFRRSHPFSKTIFWMLITTKKQFSVINTP